jgi:predicted lipoprotein
MIDNNTAIFKLYPQVDLIRGDVAYDADGNEVAYDLAAVNAYVAANEYKSKRAAEYPSIVDQLDTIYHDGIDAWKEQINTIKEKYPKG